MYESLQEVLQATLELANTSMQKSKDKSNTEKGIYDRLNSNMYEHVQCSVHKNFHDNMNMTNTTNKLTVVPFYN